MGFIWVIVVGAIAGWMGGSFMKVNEYGVRADIAIGIVGAFVAAILLRMIGPAGAGIIASVIVATIGAMILLFTLRRFMVTAPVATPRPKRRY